MKIQENFSLKEYNTFGIDKKARFFVEAKDQYEVESAIALSRKLDMPLFILGGGSNVLFTSDLDFLVVKISIEGIKPIREDENHIYVQAGAGVVWHHLVTYAIQQNWAGIENLALIPGTVGAAPMQNIGAYGVEIKDVFDHLEAIQLATGKIENFTKEDCRFDYRESVFKNVHKNKYIITRVTFKLNKQPKINTSYGDIKNTIDKLGFQKTDIKAVSEAVIHIRQQKLPDPKIIGNAGSFFKNPTVSKENFEQLKKANPEIPGYPNEKGIKLPAAWLIEQAGWKGKKFGLVGVHQNQPLVLVNYGGGDGKEILGLSEKIQEDIKAKFGVVLEREVNVI